MTACLTGHWGVCFRLGKYDSGLGRELICHGVVKLIHLSMGLFAKWVLVYGSFSSFADNDSHYGD